jgi:mRNA-degrading endonuclease toxin of MazEF toxin-antitoxin module
MMRRGRLHWAEMEKRRPVLILSPESRNERASDLIVVPCSAVLRGGPWHVRLARGEGGLARPSVLLCEQITTILKRRVDPEPLGPLLTTTRMAEVERAVLLAIGILEPPALHPAFGASY